MDELVDPYRVVLFTELENLDFCVIENTYIDVDELNVILSIDKHRESNNDDEIDIEFNKWLKTCH